jgi:hypothetical protein
MTLSSEIFETARLIEAHPPRFTHPNKALIYRIACPPGAVHHGKIEVLRGAELPVPHLYPGSGATIVVPHVGVFEYASDGGVSGVEWHLNFAHHDLFCMYGGPLLAQDELQVAEHPALASLREAMISGASKTKPLTVENGAPTPVLIKGVERRCRIDSRAVYGHAFARADSALITRSTAVLDPPSLSNLLAIEAPYGGRGFYRSLELEFILSTAYSGFRAAKLASSEARATTIHTGFWGCGAYGGDRVLMTMLQLVAARLAEIDRLVFHTVDVEGLRFFDDAIRRLNAFSVEPVPTAKLLAKILAERFAWGVGNGT